MNSINISAELHRRIKKEALREGLTVRDFTERLILNFKPNYFGGFESDINASVAVSSETKRVLKCKAVERGVTIKKYMVGLFNDYLCENLLF
jgi:hypothetical protein